MISDYRCFFCFARAFEKLLLKENIPNEAKNRFTLEMIRLYTDRLDGFNSPDFSRDLHNLLRSYSHNPDPYKEEKREDTTHRQLSCINQVTSFKITLIKQIS